MPVQQSSGSSDNRYLDPGFYSKPENQFWNKPTHTIVDRNGSVDVVLATNENGKNYYEESLMKREEYERKYRAHNI